MAQRKRNVVIEPNYITQEHVFTIYTDEGFVQDVKAIEGVTGVFNLDTPPNLHSTRYHVWYDPRYDKAEIMREIEELNVNADIPDAFTDEARGVKA